MWIIFFLCDPTNFSVFFLQVIVGHVVIKNSAKISEPMKRFVISQAKFSVSLTHCRYWQCGTHPDDKSAAALKCRQYTSTAVVGSVVPTPTTNQQQVFNAGSTQVLLHFFSHACSDARLKCVRRSPDTFCCCPNTFGPMIMHILGV